VRPKFEAEWGGGRTLQEWRFTQQCDQRFKPLGHDTVLVATFYDCLTTEDEDGSFKISGTTHQMGTSHPRKLDSPSDSVSIIIRYPSRRQTGPTHTLFHCFCIHRSMYLLFSPPHSKPDIHKEILLS
jgi:hypothetical protein